MGNIIHNITNGIITEAALEKSFIQQCQSLGFEKTTINNEGELLENARIQLSKLNRKVLKNQDLSKAEFDQILHEISKKNITYCARLLRDKFIITRDDGTRVYIQFIAEYHKNNVFQVANQITTRAKYGNARYDVTLLINGLPIYQIELKRAGVDINEAINQINRYKSQAYPGLFKFIQVFVVTTGVETRYFANTNSSQINKSFTFYWTDESNVRISELMHFTKRFLNPNFACELFWNYVFVANLDSGDEKLMVMRPYQIYATKSVLHHILKRNEDCYVFHVTASGKTCTSWRISRLLMRNSTVEKVIFLSDRTELDEQTTSEFEKFDGKAGSSRCIADTVELADKMADRNVKFINTMVHKMSLAVKEPKYRKKFNYLQNERIVFIIDECHRSQCGEMHKVLKSFFKKARYVGFTGTPIFKENQELKDVITTDLFGVCAHAYTYPQAIADKSVLPIDIQYYQTMIEDFKANGDCKVNGINKEEALLHEKRIQHNVDYMIKTIPMKCNIAGRHYCAMLTTQDIRMAIRYYKEFKKQPNDLKVAMIYSEKGENTEFSQEKIEAFDEALTDYNNMFGTNFHAKSKCAPYKRDLANRIKAGDIDLVIVVDIFITGFDAPKINTLFVDREMKWQQIMQAFARTIRLEAECKTQGNIICFRNLKDKVDAALKLFSKTDDISTIQVESYDVRLKQAQKFVSEVISIVPTPSDVNNLFSEKKKKDFVVAFQSLMLAVSVLRTNANFSWKQLSPITEQSFNEYVSCYKSIAHWRESARKAKEVSILDDIDFKLELLTEDHVNYDYLMELINAVVWAEGEAKKDKIEELYKYLEEHQNEMSRSKYELIIKFLHNFIYTLKKNESFDEAFDVFVEIEKEDRFNEFIINHNYKPDILQKLIDEYSFSQKIDTTLLESGFVNSAGFLERVRRGKIAEEFIKSYTNSFC